MSLIDTFIEVRLKSEDDFLKVKETLTRIGITSKSENKLYQSCHILHKQGKYYIVHFKELFALDGKPTNFSEEDKSRRDAIALLLEEWNLIDIVSNVSKDEANSKFVRVIPYKDKKDWELISKYSIGKKR